MKRYVTLEEISDGRKYSKNDMVKADCHGCKGCSDCCHGMGSSIVLDPYDVYRLTKDLSVSFEELLPRAFELNVVDGCILPNIKMQGLDERCSFLDENERCSIHESRPGICRLFPLGRYYEDGKMYYILQTNECRANHSKIKVEKWVDTPRLSEYEKYICDWHYMLNALEEDVLKVLSEGQQERANQWNMLLLQIFFFAHYDTEQSFYEQFWQRKEIFLREK